MNSNLKSFKENLILILKIAFAHHKYYTVSCSQQLDQAKSYSQHCEYNDLTCTINLEIFM